jgi:DNA-binding beta-propeller fold protein YncE
MKFSVATFCALLLIPAVGVTQTLSNPESIEFHARMNRTLISSTNNGSILARDAAGTLSLFSAAPVSPYGIELLAGTLFVLDSGSVKGYDIDSAAEVMNLPLSGAGFLNGITSNGVDTLYVSDFSNKTLYTVDVSNLGAPQQSAPVSTGSATPNGLAFDRAGQRVLVATWGSNARILSLDLVPGATPATLINTTLGNIDGITLDCNGAIVVAAWSSCGTSGGCLRRFDPPFTLTSTAQVLVNGLSSPADIDYDRVSANIAVPQSGNNTVSFHASGCEPALFASDFER